MNFNLCHLILNARACTGSLNFTAMNHLQDVTCPRCRVLIDWALEEGLYSVDNNGLVHDVQDEASPVGLALGAADPMTPEEVAAHEEIHQGDDPPSHSYYEFDD